MTSPQGPDAPTAPIRDDATAGARPHSGARTVDPDAGPGGVPSYLGPPSPAVASAPRPERPAEPSAPAERSATSQAVSPDRDPKTSGPQRAPEVKRPADGAPTTVVPDAAATKRPVPPRAAPRPVRPAERTGVRGAGRSRKARLSLKRVDPWSVFVFSLVAALFLGVALVVAVAVLYAVLSGLGVLSSINELFAEVTGGDVADPLITSGRVLGGAAVFGAVNVVLLTLLATLGALLYNVCASFTGGVELTLGERDG